MDAYSDLEVSSLKDSLGSINITKTVWNDSNTIVLCERIMIDMSILFVKCFVVAVIEVTQQVLFIVSLDRISTDVSGPL